MAKFFYTAIVALTTSIFIGCDPCLGIGYGCTDQFSFRLADRNTQADLVFSTVPIYQKDSVYLTTSLPGYSGAMSYIDSNKFTSNLLIPVDTFFLRISYADIDTLVLTYDFMRVKCCKTKDGFGKLLSIEYNGVVAIKDGETYIFKK